MYVQNRASSNLSFNVNSATSEQIKGIKTSPLSNASSISQTKYKTSLSPTPSPNSTKPVSSPVQSPSPIPSPVLESALDDIQIYIISEINDYRKSQGLGEIAVDPNTCSYANTRAKEILADFSHKGHEQRIDSKNLPYPSWSLVTENIAMTSDYKQVVDLWIKSSGHAENMRRDTPYVCVERYDKYYAYEGWKS